MNYKAEMSVTKTYVNKLVLYSIKLLYTHCHYNLYYVGTSTLYLLFIVGIYYISVVLVNYNYN